MTIPAYPLTWPDGWKRTASGYRKSATFTKYKKQLSVNDGVTRCREELGRMGVSDADLVISTNVPLRMDGWPRSDQAAPQDPGVAVYWRDKAGATLCMAMDLDAESPPVTAAPMVLPRVAQMDLFAEQAA